MGTVKRSVSKNKFVGASHSSSCVCMGFERRLQLEKEKGVFAGG
jgi:hypothetical protein